jgi:cytochrome b involved in lipid metabolism
MNQRWRALVESASKAQRMNHAQVRRLIGLLDLEPPLDLDALGAVLDAEAADQRARGLAALAPLLEIASEAPAARAARGALTTTEDAGRAGGDPIPRDQLSELRAGAPTRTAAIIDEIIDRHDRFERRLGWLLRPTTAEELASLDPRRDCNQIYHAVSFDFRAEQKLFALLFELAALMIPYSSLMLASTGELTLRGYKRLNDTVMFFSNMIELGLDSRRGREAVARVNQIHGRYSLPNQLFRFILSGIMFIPLTWNQRLGWRPFTQTERLGWFYTFAEMGRAMHVEGISDDFEQMQAWWTETVAQAGRASAVGQRLFHELIIQTLATYPADLRRPILSAIFCGMPERYRQLLDIPPAPAPALARVRESLRLVGEASSRLPRVPWIRSLQLHPMYRRIEQIGVDDRSAFLPRATPAGALAAGDADGAPSAGRENAGFPVHQRPINSPAEIPEMPLRPISPDELARHADPEDAWLALDGDVYEVTRFLNDHPGGRAVLAAQLGRDASAAFDQVGHSAGARIVLANFRIGRLEDTAPAHRQGPLAARAEPSQPLAAAPGRRVEGQPGSDQRSRSWDGMLDDFERHTSLYERAKLRPDKP